MQHPCKQDCPERTAECKRTCERWATYERAQRDEYEQRRMAALIRDTEMEMGRRRTKVGCFLASRTTPRHTGER